MFVRMITTAAGPGGNFESGHEYELPDERAAAFIAAGAATEIVKPAPETAVPAAQGALNDVEEVKTPDGGTIAAQAQTQQRRSSIPQAEI